MTDFDIEFKRAESTIERAKLYNDHIDLCMKKIKDLEYNVYLLKGEIEKLKELVGTDSIKILNAIKEIQTIANTIIPIATVCAPS